MKGKILRLWRGGRVWEWTAWRVSKPYLMKEKKERAGKKDI